MLEVREITTDADMKSLRPEWNALVERSRSAGVFQTWEWLFCCRKHFCARKALRLLTVWQDGRLVGIAPLEAAHVWGLPVTRLQFIGGEVSDYMDIIADPDLESEVTEAIFNHLRALGGWHALDLQQLPPDSPALVNPPANRAQVYEQEICPYLPLPETWQAFLAGLSKKARSNLSYYERKSAKEFSMTMGVLGEDDLDEGMDAFFRLHQARWQRRKLPGTFYSPRMRAFHTEAARLLQSCGWLRLHGIRLDGTLQAVLYCFAHKRKGYYYLGGFEPELSRYSLGTVLTGAAIRDAIELGLTEFDFLRGNEPYKTRWTQQSRTTSRIIGSSDRALSPFASSLCLTEHRVQTRVKDWLHSRFGNG